MGFFEKHGGPPGGKYKFVVDFQPMLPWHTNNILIIISIFLSFLGISFPAKVVKLRGVPPGKTD